ncbi:hypothetical protein JW964_24645 [candidate division KSB1 bacterium]|nr:hypothetical protein [candidate division KSB1 bacterium]
MLFRISHRYYPEVKSGYESYFGINGPASILVSLGYGLSENLSVSIGHSNLLHEWEAGLKWQPLVQGKWPFSLAFYAGSSWITQEQVGQKIFRSENFKFHTQVMASYHLPHRMTFLLVPAYTTSSDYWDGDTKGTLSLGFGGRYGVTRNLSVIGEWVPILSGLQNQYQGWGIGLEAKTGGHVFQLFINNSVGLTTDTFLPGGDLDIGNNEYRFGFNIYRTFWF